MSAATIQDIGYDGVEVFAATMKQERDGLGEKVTAFIARVRAGGGDVSATTVTQSSDHAFHCFVITVFYVRNIKRGILITERAS